MCPLRSYAPTLQPSGSSRLVRGTSRAERSGFGKPATLHDNPTFSPDGRHIAFSRQPCLWEGEEGYHCLDIQLYVMDADGANVRAIPTSQAGIPPEVVEIEKDVVAGSPAWSPDGEAIYYYSQHTYYLSSPDGGEEEILAGPEIRRVSLGGSDELVARNGYSPTVGPDGRVAFVRPRDDDGPPRYTSGRIFSVGPDGSDLRLESASLAHCFAPDFHPGSGRMVCHGFAPAAGLVNDHGSPFAPPGSIQRVGLPDRTIALRGVRGAFPALTTDGEVVSTIRGNHRRAFRRGGNESGGLPLHVSAIDGTGSRELITPPSGIPWDPDVAQEAGWLVFTVGQSFSGARENVDIWKARLDGSGAKNLTAGYDFNAALPSVSADGRRIVFRRPRGPTPGASGLGEITSVRL